MRSALLLFLILLSTAAFAGESAPVEMPTTQAAVSNAFSYQGRLILNNFVVTVNSDLRFTLYTASAGGVVIGSPYYAENVTVTDGRFNVQIDFGANAFDGQERWLSIEARSPHDPTNSLPFTTLTPRQEITAVPYALHALNGGSGGGSGYWELSSGRITNVGSSSVFINRNYAVGSEYFGVHAPVTGYGGMYITTDGNSALPFYGYKAGTGAAMWTYLDGASLDWRVHNGGLTRLEVRNTGEVAIGSTITLDNSDDTDLGGSIQLRKTGGPIGAELKGSTGGGTQGGSLALYTDTSTTATVVLDGEYGNGGGGALILRNTSGATSFELGADFNPGDRGIFRMYKPDGTKTVEIDASETGTVDQGAALKLYDDAGVLKIELDADFGGSGTGRVITEVLEITGGADFSEQFDVSGSASTIEPGSVVSIDPASPGDLRLSATAYDRRVAGIVSGAGGVRPGMLMGQRGTEADGRHPVALSGRVYCKVDASFGAVEPGDLLTTSPTTGHAMKVSDHSQATGAVIGKAMTSLEAGRGLVLVLVSLQ